VDPVQAAAERSGIDGIAHPVDADGGRPQGLGKVPWSAVVRHHYRAVRNEGCELTEAEFACQ
jgi:hypothetical protein